MECMKLLNSLGEFLSAMTVNDLDIAAKEAFDRAEVDRLGTLTESLVGCALSMCLI